MGVPNFQSLVCRPTAAFRSPKISSDWANTNTSDGSYSPATLCGRPRLILSRLLSFGWPNEKIWVTPVKVDVAAHIVYRGPHCTVSTRKMLGRSSILLSAWEVLKVTGPGISAGSYRLTMWTVQVAQLHYLPRSTISVRTQRSKQHKNVAFHRQP